MQELLQNPDFTREWVHSKPFFTVEHAVAP